MKKNSITKIISLLAVFSICLTSAGCGGSREDKNKVELVVDLHGWMPSSSTMTSAGSQPYTATQDLADEFMKLNPDIKIKWATTKPVGDTDDTIATWFTTKISTDSCPAIAFSWGTRYQDRGWYLDLDDYLETPNEYEEGNTRWGDMFEDYLWNLGTVADAKGAVVAIPLVLYAGTATGYYYNKNIVTEAFENNRTLAALMTGGKTIEEIIRSYTGFNDALSAVTDEYGTKITCVAPSTDVGGITFGSWIESFCLGPSYAGKLMDSIDYNKDGVLDSTEQVRATLEGYFNPVKYDGAKEMLAYLYEYYNETLDSGWQSSDYDAIWKSGNVAFKESGIWSYNTEASTVHGGSETHYEWGVIPSPIISVDSGSQYVSDIQYTEKGFYNPAPDLQVNIMKPAVEDKPEVLAAAVKFLKFLTSVENNEYMVGAKDSGIPSVKGAEYPSTITESGYVLQSFPIKPSADWPDAFTSDQNYVLNRDFKLWVNNSSVDPKDYTSDINKEFYAKVNAAQIAGANSLVQSLDIDITGWNIK